MIFNKDNEKKSEYNFFNFGRPNTSNPPPPSTSGFVQIFRSHLGGSAGRPLWMPPDITFIFLSLEWAAPYRIRILFFDLM